MTRWSWIPTVLLLLSHPPAEATVVAASGPPEGEAVVLAVDGPAEEGYPWSRGGGPELGVGQSFRSSRALDLAAITVRGPPAGGRRLGGAAHPGRDERARGRPDGPAALDGGRQAPCFGRGGRGALPDLRNRRPLAATAAALAQPVTWVGEPHVFSMDDVLGDFDGTTYGDDAGIVCTESDCEGEDPFVDQKTTVTLYPIDSTFSFYVTDFLGGVQKVPCRSARTSTSPST